MKTTIASDVKFKINFPGQIFLHHNTAIEVYSLDRVFRSNRSSALVDELLGGKLSRTLAALF